MVTISGGNANALRGTETYRARARQGAAHQVAATPTPYGALKLLTIYRYATHTLIVAATPTPYGALKRVFVRLVSVVLPVAATPTPYGALKPRIGENPVFDTRQWRQRQRPTGH